MACGSFGALTASSSFGMSGEKIQGPVSVSAIHCILSHLCQLCSYLCPILQDDKRCSDIQAYPRRRKVGRKTMGLQNNLETGVVPQKEFQPHFSKTLNKFFLSVSLAFIVMYSVVHYNNGLWPPKKPPLLAFKARRRMQHLVSCRTWRSGTLGTFPVWPSHVALSRDVYILVQDVWDIHQLSVAA